MYTLKKNNLYLKPTERQWNSLSRWYCGSDTPHIEAYSTNLNWIKMLQKELGGEIVPVKITEQS